MTGQKPKEARICSVEAWPTPHEPDLTTAAVVHVAVKGQSYPSFFGEVIGELLQKSYVQRINVARVTAAEEEDAHICMEVSVTTKERAEKLVIDIEAILEWHSA